MFDVHCHVDLYPDPVLIAKECERLGINTIAVTNLPSHFMLGYSNLKGYKKIRVALGMHPLYAERHNSEFPLFLECLDKTSYVGEIGLDFSKDGIETKEIQLNTFKSILTAIQGNSKVLSIHSRKAENEVFNFLLEYNIRSAIFHWYSGPLQLINKIVDAGFFFSINSAMIKSKGGQEIIRRIPLSNILTESDGPFIEYNKRPVRPSDLNVVVTCLASVFEVTEQEIQKKINGNLQRLVSEL